MGHVAETKGKAAEFLFRDLAFGGQVFLQAAGEAPAMLDDPDNKKLAERYVAWNQSQTVS
ncbi:hypothetical protein LCGC14_1838060, partial [marine sediment metagenome]